MPPLLIQQPPLFWECFPLDVGTMLFGTCFHSATRAFVRSGTDHYSSSTKLYRWYYTLGQVAFPWHPPNPDLSVGLPDVEARFITPEFAFQLLQSTMAVSFTPIQPTLGIAHGYLRLECVCSAMETHFMKIPTISFLRCFQRQFGTR